MKNIIIGSAVVLVIVVALILAVGSKPPPEEVVPQPLRPLRADHITRLEISRPVGSGRNAGRQHITLEQHSTMWQLKKPIDAPANRAIVDKMVRVLAELHTAEPIAASAVDPVSSRGGGARKLTVTAHLTDGTTRGVIIGQTRAGWSQIQPIDSTAVYRATGSLRTVFNKSPRALRDRAVLRLDRDSISKMKFTNEHGSLTLLRKGTDHPPTYAPQGVELSNFNNWRARKVASVLSLITARDFADERITASQAGLDDNAASVEIEARRDGTPGTFTIQIGKEEQRRHLTYIKTNLSDELFLISNHLLASLKSRAEDFARTDEELAREREAIKRAAEHAEHHRRANRGEPHDHSHDHDHDHPH